jgi:suppressor of G2 allele of SKP1
MSASNLFSKGNAAFVEENYQDALKYYTEAIEIDDSKEEYFSNRAHTHIKLESYKDAVADATKAIEICPANAKAYLRKGMAYFRLNEFESAKEAFMEGQKKDEGNKSFEEWVEKCNTQLKLVTNKDEAASKSAEAMSGGEKISASPANTKTQPKPADIPMPSGPKTRYDWYQTETTVVITVMLKNVKKEDLTLDIMERSVGLCVKLPSGSDYSLELDLAHPIVPNQSRHKILSTKIEVILKKADGIRWQKLEGDDEQSTVKHFNPGSGTTNEAAHQYPSSSHYTRDWDKIVANIKQEEKSEKLEGDAALNQLFQQIYADGSEEVRKAMNKSFVESGGTVLSTNWKEIADKKTEVKPPDGMEYRKYEY